MVITETWLSNNVDNSVIGLNGFSTFRLDRSDGRRGGDVCVYVNNRFPVFHLEDISVPDIESIWLLLKPSRLPRGFNSIILGAIYHPPRNDDRSLLAHVMESLDHVLASNPGALSLHEGFVPPLWKCANVTLIPKCFPISDIDSDVRPISLTPIVSKILESFLYNWLSQSIDDHIDNLQFGSIRKSSTTMALIYMLHKWYQAMDTPGTLLRICMLDFSKAFDRIDFNILSEKLHRRGVHPVLIN